MSIEITMPRLSDTMESGTILKWNVSPGDDVSSGDVVADVETDKATMELAVYDDGKIAKILVDEGETVDIGTLIAVMAEEDEDTDSVAASAANGSAVSAPAPTPAVEAPAADVETPVPAATASAPAPAPASAPASAGQERTRVSPVARRLAEEHGIDLRTITGSGPSGRIIKRDVLTAMDTATETAASIAPSAASTSEITPVDVTVPVPVVPVTTPGGELGSSLADRRVPLSNMRQTIAKRLVESKTTIPHYQVSMSFDMDPLLDLRRTLNIQLEPAGVKLSVNDFLMRACALAMYRNPEVNASWGGDHVLVHGAINIGMAIALPPERGGGLVVGVVRHADQKSLRAIAAESRQLAEKARTRGLSVEDMSDSTFTLSNLGMFGVEHFTAIINPPNSAILAVGGAVEKPVVRNGELTIGREMTATLSSDHRIIDGAMAAQYLATLRELIEQPAAVLV